MIIENGTIEVKGKKAGGINPESGFPVLSTDVSWGKPILCQFYHVKMNNLAIVNNEHYKHATYEILIEEQVGGFSAEQIRLKRLTGEEVGEFSVISSEPLQAVRERKIIV